MRPVFDGHNDVLTADDHERFVAGRPDGHLDLPRMRAGGVRAAIFAVWCPPPGGHDVALPAPGEPASGHGLTDEPLADQLDHDYCAEFATRAAGRLAALERAGHLTSARSVADLDAVRAHPELPPAAILHFEGAEAMDPGLEALELWYAAGLRSLGPVWSRPTAFGHGVPFRAPSSPDTGPGLTEPGRALVARCGELGIAVDLSHLNEAGFWDVAGIGAGPLIASHSAAHALCRSSRNLTDRQLDEIAATGGLVGIVYACPFLREDFAEDTDTPIEVIARHAAYVAERIGVAHVGLGSDFDGAPIPDELGDVAGVPRLLDALAAVGFSDSELDAIAWDNWRRVLGDWWRD